MATLQNVVAKFYCGQDIDTIKLSRVLPQSYFNRLMHPTLFHHDKRKCVFLIYSSGKVIIN